MVTCPEAGDNFWKRELIPHVLRRVRVRRWKGAIHFGRGLRPIS